MADDNDALRELGNVSKENAAHLIQHYLYFSNESVGKKVARHLREMGFDVEDRIGADGEDWLVLAKHRMIPSKEEVSKKRRFFESIVMQYNGECDGWEAVVQSDGC